MTIYNVSTLSSYSVISTFTPGTDILRFDGETITSLNLGVYATSGGSALMGSGKTIVLSGISLSQLDTVRIEVADGAALIIAGSTFQAVDGTSGNDQLLGQMIGSATLRGGAGNDVYVVDDAIDRVVEDVNAGIDTVRSSASYYLSANIENLQLLGTANLSGTGNDLNNQVLGNRGNNVLDGGAGNDWLDGSIGADTMIGGTGDDNYLISDSTDLIVENTGGGADSVRTSIAYTLASEVENLFLEGSAHIAGTGNASNNILVGNAGNNVLTGAAGNDKLNGGAGVDTLIGGTGNDLYTIADTIDTLIEAAGEGTDTVRSSISYTLLTNFENLELTGTANLNGNGNAANNILIGNSGNNVLNGDTGADTFAGGLGDDTYVVENVGDSVIENVNAGTDTVRTYITYTLGANLEHLQILGTANLNGTGNALNNNLLGNTGNNRLDAGAGNDWLDGSVGADTMIGGTGNDGYAVDDVLDVVVEAASGGVLDVVRSSISYTLGANVENLELASTAGNINGSGNELNNTIKANAGANVLTGGLGADTFVLKWYGAQPSASSADVITDFLSGTDRLQINATGFGVGDGDAVLENGVVKAGPGDFSTAAELVIITGNTAPTIDPTSAAAVIGSATSAYVTGAKALFVVDNGVDSAVYLFTSSGNDAQVSASELTLLATLQQTASTVLSDYALTTA